MNRVNRDVKFVLGKIELRLVKFDLISSLGCPGYCHVYDVFWKQVVQSSTPVIAMETFLSVVQGPRGTHRC